MADKPVKAAPQGEANTDAAKLAEQALDQASSAVADLRAAAEAGEATGTNMDLPVFKQVIADAEATGIDLLHDVNLNVSIELGRTHMLVEDVLRLNEGSVVELDKLAGDPVDIYVNDRLVARGEVLVLNDNFCVRVSEIIASIEDLAEAEQIADAPKA
jgi:flagellar motor switch protein FliN/FliY